MLNADHRSVCKFADIRDPNYQAIRDALAGTVQDIVEMCKI
jgi:hypothetical protein